MLNKEIFKRASTYANMLVVLVGGLMGLLPNAPIEPEIKQWIMFVGGIIVLLCQTFKKEVKNGDSGKTSK